MQKQTEKIPVTPSPFPRLVVLGGGFAGISLVKKLKGCRVQIVLFDRNNYHTFQPLLYQVATAGLEPDSIADPLRKQLEPVKNFYFRMGEVFSVDPGAKQIHTEIGALDYDFLVIATGSRTNYFGNESVMQNGFPLKQIPQALDLRSHILQNFEAATITRDPQELEARMNVVIVGGGPTGVEVAGALGELKKNILPNDYPELEFEKMKIILVEGTGRLLNGMSESSGEKALRYLHKFDVDVQLNTIVKTYDGKSAELSSGQRIDTYTLVWAAGVQGNFPDGLPEAAVEGNRLVVVDIGKFHFGGFFAWVIWMFVHLISIIGFRNRLIVFSNWVWNYFTYDKGTRLIIRKFIPKSKAKAVETT